MTIKYFNEEDGNYYDVTGVTGSSLVIGSNGFEVKTNAKVYRASMTQSGTSDPTIDYEFENTLGTIVWTYVSAGIYNGNLNGAFSAEFPEITRTFFNASFGYGINYYTIKKIDSDNIQLIVKDKIWDVNDNVLKTTFIDFLIY